jgi:pimeloyl-ACP methyl ester carboxylesterase
VKEYPVFVPFGEEHLAAIVTVPDGDPRGLVMLLPGGGGAPRSHRFSMWTRAARELAEREIASVRMEWRGVGDSTGQARFGFQHLPVDDVVTVAEFAMRAVGTDRLGIGANCMGARTGLKASPRLATLHSAVLILIKPLARVRSKQAVVVKSKSLVNRLPIKNLARKLYWGRRQQKAAPMMEAIDRLHRRADVLLMETLSSEKVGKLPQMVEDMREGNGSHRIELRDLPGGERRAFHRLERQRFVIDSIVGWFDETFPAAETSSPDHAEREAASSRAPAVR